MITYLKNKLAYIKKEHQIFLMALAMAKGMSKKNKALDRQ